MEHKTQNIFKKESFYEQLRNKIDLYSHSVYKLTKNFPKEEIYGIVSQLRRSALSVALNYIEGYARGSKSKSFNNFLHISYGSLKEAQYLLEFSYKENFLSESEYGQVAKLGNEIGAMLWGIIQKL